MQVARFASRSIRTFMHSLKRRVTFSASGAGNLMADHEQRMKRVRVAIDGLSIGDAFGQRFFFLSIAAACMPARTLPDGPWYYTDDTEMALAIAEVLEEHGQIDQHRLAEVFARRYRVDPHRGYGAGAQRLLQGLLNGNAWESLTRQLFGGNGSFGNGGAMRVAPIAAYFAEEEPARIAEQANASAEVTHWHIDGRAGAIAVALAGAWAYTRSQRGDSTHPGSLFQHILEFVPPSRVRDGMERASRIDFRGDVQMAAELLGNGNQITAQDTVPICLWIAAKSLYNYVDAMWQTVAIGGDVDTNCAIVGGIVALAVGEAGIPEEWRSKRESLWRNSAPP